MSFGRALGRGPLGALRRRQRGPARGVFRRQRVRPVRALRVALTRRGVRLALLAALVIGALLLGGWLWLRDSSLVAVTRVTVTGDSGPDAGAIHSALVGAARGMTTLDVNMSQLRTAVAPYPVVADVRVSTQFPHGMRIRVIERLPVAVVSVSGRTIAVADDGTLLHDLKVPDSTLPVVPLTVPPGGPRLIDPALKAIRLLAAAPQQLLARISQVSTMPGHGLVAQIRSGPIIYFGDASDARAKWLAATAVLTDPGSAGAAYIDVNDPVRPAAGAGAQGSAGGTSGAASAGASGSGG
ncbi:MAG TPA: FtsQ-type POTRA domain-containing protein [Solirubrobacteraceae bacterium]